jgi:hypothetical protein
MFCQVTFYQHYNIGKVVDKINAGTEANTEITQLQCFPLFTILSYLNVTQIDYFSLDVEGDELKVLKTIPFDLVLIKVLFGRMEMFSFRKPSTFFM